MIVERKYLNGSDWLAAAMAYDSKRMLAGKQLFVIALELEGTLKISDVSAILASQSSVFPLLNILARY